MEHPILTCGTINLFPNPAMSLDLLPVNTDDDMTTALRVSCFNTETRFQKIVPYRARTLSSVRKVRPSSAS